MENRVIKAEALLGIISENYNKAPAMPASYLDEYAEAHDIDKDKLKYDEVEEIERTWKQVYAHQVTQNIIDVALNIEYEMESPPQPVHEERVIGKEEFFKEDFLDDEDETKDYDPAPESNVEEGEVNGDS